MGLRERLQRAREARTARADAERRAQEFYDARHQLLACPQRDPNCATCNPHLTWDAGFVTDDHAWQHALQD
jgi:hypothetical protein